MASSKRKRCAYRPCPSITNVETSFFVFPKDRERAKIWLRACNRQDLLVKSVDKLHKNYQLCEKHFEEKYISKGGTRKRLFDQAIPTIFTHAVKQEVWQATTDGELNEKIIVLSDLPCTEPESPGLEGENIENVLSAGDMTQTEVQNNVTQLKGKAKGQFVLKWSPVRQQQTSMKKIRLDEENINKIIAPRLERTDDENDLAVVKVEIEDTQLNCAEETVQFFETVLIKEEKPNLFELIGATFKEHEQEQPEPVSDGKGTDYDKNGLPVVEVKAENTELKCAEEIVNLYETELIKEERQKLLKLIGSKSKKHDQEQTEQDSKEVNEYEKIMVSVDASLNKINTAINGNFIFGDKEQGLVREAQNEIHSLLSTLVFSLVELEKENTVLKNKIEEMKKPQP